MRQYSTATAADGRTESQKLEGVLNAVRRLIKELSTVERTYEKAAETGDTPKPGVVAHAQDDARKAASGLAALLVPGVRVQGGRAPRSGAEVVRNRELIVRAGAIEPLSRLLVSGTDELRRAATAALSPLLSEREGARHAVECGVLPILVSMLGCDDDVGVRARALAALRSVAIVGGADAFHRSIRQAGAIVPLVCAVDDPASTPAMR
jgi:hypothetical protein